MHGAILCDSIFTQLVFEVIAITSFYADKENLEDALVALFINVVISTILITSLLYRNKRIYKTRRMIEDINKLTNSINNNLNKQKV